GYVRGDDRPRHPFAADCAERPEAAARWRAGDSDDHARPECFA
ncbi:MAG: hypothetical protein AVDCRST_MAG93-3332, partial [uncultured Chloroflexia bacterium]